MRGRPDLDAEAIGDVEFRRGAVVIRSDRLSYDQAEDLARATGNVVISREGNVFFGPELQLRVERFEGFFRSPTYRFARTDAGGKATLIEFIDDQRAVAIDATYSSCSPDDPDPPWILKAGRIETDNETSTGIARDAVLRFYGVPILASPVLSFPLNDERRSGFLPPAFGLDSRSGFQAAIPYYWNIAPNRDATFTFVESTKRGPAVDAEFRYLQPGYAGEADAAPAAERPRLRQPFAPCVPLPPRRPPARGHLRPGAGAARLRRRLLEGLPRRSPLADAAAAAVRRAAVPAVRRLVDLRPGAALAGAADGGPDDPDRPAALRAAAAGRARATPHPGAAASMSPSRASSTASPTRTTTTSRPRQTGDRFHALGSISRPFYTPGWTLVPKVSFNAASYSVDQPLPDGRRSASRVIPTLSIDSAWAFERDTSLFGKAYRETLEPRLFYVNTPFRAQDDLPNFDAFGKDFNFDSIFTENTFSGIDRVSDSHQLTAGLTSRLVNPQTGVEALRLGIMQRYLFSDQLVTPDGQPLTQRFSDILVLGSTSLVPNWTFDAQAQYNPDSRRIVRSIAGFRYSPGPYRTLNMNYRLSRGLSEQVEVGWQWPVYGRPRAGEGGDRSASGAACSGALYSVGRINYSTRDSRLTDSASWAWNTMPAAGSAGWSSSGCPPAAAKRRPGCWCSWNSSAFPGSAPIRCGS